MHDAEAVADGAQPETDEDIDRQLLAIRKKATELLPHGVTDRQIDFYYPPPKEPRDPARSMSTTLVPLTECDAPPLRPDEAPGRRRASADALPGIPGASPVGVGVLASDDFHNSWTGPLSVAATRAQIVHGGHVVGGAPG